MTTCAGNRYYMKHGRVRSCAGCKDCSGERPHRLHAALDATIDRVNPHVTQITRLEAHVLKLQTLLREAVIYVEPGTCDGEDLRARIYREIPRKGA